MLPFVSVVVPTRDRRLFIPQLLRGYRQQDYPLDRMELVVLDDGADPVGDLLERMPGARYLRSDTPEPVGRKRNRLMEAARGDIIVHMDDDDYYPRSRVSHAVSRLAESGLEIAGASVLYIYFAREQQIAVAGPYGPNHATAATMAYRRRYADQHRYDDGCALGEEPVFTNGYSEPMVQLEPVRTMLCIAHAANSFGKSRVDRRPTGYGLKDFVSCREARSFYTNKLPRLFANAAGPGPR